MPRNYFEDPSFLKAFEDYENSDLQDAQSEFEQSKAAAAKAEAEFQAAKKEYAEGIPYLRAVPPMLGQASADLVAPLMRGLGNVTPDAVQEAAFAGDPLISNYEDYADSLNRRSDWSSEFRGTPKGTALSG